MPWSRTRASCSRDGPRDREAAEGRAALRPAAVDAAGAEGSAAGAGRAQPEGPDLDGEVNVSGVVDVPPSLGPAVETQGRHDEPSPRHFPPETDDVDREVNLVPVGKHTGAEVGSGFFGWAVPVSAGPAASVSPSPTHEELERILAHEARHFVVAHAVDMEPPAYVTWRGTDKFAGEMGWGSLDREDKTPSDVELALQRFRDFSVTEAERFALQMLETAIAGPVEETPETLRTCDHDLETAHVYARFVYGEDWLDAFKSHARRVLELVRRPEVNQAIRCIGRLLARAPNRTLSGGMYGLLDEDLGLPGTYYTVERWT
jgi:hypothetical protein